jgi:phosphoinositide-3-kinase, regulatory subunit 4
MGQGYSITTLPAASAGIDAPEMADLTYEKSLGKSRFMKCIRARHKDGLVIAKVVLKPYSSLELSKYVKILAEERAKLAEIPNALGYHRIVETSTNGYLVRQYINNSLYDRMSTRPFLENIEKKWIAFQLLCAVRDSHARDIYHGDIKAENVLVTSWNWLYLTDYSSCFKPTYLPEDNPADFSFFFDTSASDSRDRTCYIAPERFLQAGEDPANKSPINWAMDIFSVGCLIGELFTDRKFFSLNGILNYRLSKGISAENPLLKEIADKEIREMVAHMIQVDPEARYRADEYLSFWKHKAFPEYFYSFLHPYMNLITDPSSGQATLTSGTENLGEADDRIDRVYSDFDKISFSLGYGDVAITRKHPLSEDELIPLEVDIPNNRHQASADVKRPPDDGSLIFLTIIVASLRHTARSSSKVRGCELLLAFAERVPDEAKLDRILPYLMLLLNDESEVVKVATLRTITQVVSYLAPSFTAIC